MSILDTNERVVEINEQVRIGLIRRASIDDAVNSMECQYEKDDSFYSRSYSFAIINQYNNKQIDGVKYCYPMPFFDEKQRMDACRTYLDHYCPEGCKLEFIDGF